VGSVERLLRERLRIACIQLCCCLQEPVLSKNQCPSNPLLIRGPAQERQLKLFNSMLMHHPHDAMLHSIRKYKEDAYAPARRIPGIAQVYAHCTAQQLLYLHRRSTSAAYARMQHSSLGRMLCDSIAQCNRGPVGGPLLRPERPQALCRAGQRARPPPFQAQPLFAAPCFSTSVCAVRSGTPLCLLLPPSFKPKPRLNPVGPPLCVQPGRHRASSCL